MKSIIESKKQARILAKQQGIKLKQALEILAHQHQFPDWKSYKNSLDTFWYSQSSAYLNHWFASHKDALMYLEQHQGYLLTYKGDYFVATAEYIEHLGIDPNAEVWKVINYDVSHSNAIEKMYQYLTKVNLAA